MLGVSNMGEGLLGDSKAEATTLVATKSKPAILRPAVLDLCDGKCIF